MISHSAFTGLTVPIRCTPSTNSKSGMSILANDLSRSTPALATRMSTRPQVSIACLIMLATPASSVTDEPLAIASPPAALLASTTLPAASDEPPEPSTEPPRSLTTTLAPRLASSSACWRPSPPPAPVTIATLPSKRMSAMRLAPTETAALCADAADASTGRLPPLPWGGWSRSDRVGVSDASAAQGIHQRSPPDRFAVTLPMKGRELSLQELHQHPLADQEGRAVGAHHHLDHPLVGALSWIVRLQLAGAVDRGDAQHLAGIGLRLVGFGGQLHRLADRHERLRALRHLGAHDPGPGGLQVEHRGHV